jgi:hypothetical protein
MDIFISFRLSERERVKSLIYDPLVAMGLRDHVYYSAELMHAEASRSRELSSDLIGRLNEAHLLVVAGSRKFFDDKEDPICHNEVQHFRNKPPDALDRRPLTIFGMMDEYVGKATYFSDSRAFFVTNFSHRVDLFNPGATDQLATKIRQTWLERLPKIETLTAACCADEQRKRLAHSGLSAPAELFTEDGTSAGTFALLPSLVYAMDGRSVQQAENLLIAIEVTGLGLSWREIDRELVTRRLFDQNGRWVGTARLPTDIELRLAAPFIAPWATKQIVGAEFVAARKDHRAYVMDMTRRRVVDVGDRESWSDCGARLACTVERSILR